MKAFLDGLLLALAFKVLVLSIGTAVVFVVGVLRE